MPSALVPLNPVPPKFACQLCGHPTFKVVVRGKTSRQQAAGHGEISMEEYACTSRHHGQFFQVVECAQCRLRTLFPLPETSAIEQAYTKVKDDEYVTIEPSRHIAFNKLLHRLQKFTHPPGKLLDVGCYTGVFPLAASHAGWDAFGIDPSQWATSIASQRLPGKIKQGYLAEDTFPAGSFDVVTSWDVIEHVTNPSKEIELMARLLRPGGWLFLSTMASEASIVKILGARWPWYMPMHLFYFTPKTLNAFIEEAGLDLHTIAPYPHYTTVKYALWKLESLLGPVGRLVSKTADKIGLSKKIIKIDLGDFFLLAAQKPINRSSA